MSNPIRDRMVDCEAWDPPPGKGPERVCRECGEPGKNHWPAAVFRGLGLPADGAQRVADAIANRVREMQAERSGTHDRRL